MSVDDLDFSEFDTKVERTFTDTYNDFISCKNNDTIQIGRKRVIRAFARDELKKGTNDKEIAFIRDHPKQVEVGNIASPLPSPFELLKYDEHTSVQQLVDKHIAFLPYYGSFAYSCSCGSGKTIAGLQIISALRCRTLIISSRNAVNDQWRTIIEKLYPDLIIETKGRQWINGVRLKPKEQHEFADIYIDTPQYLAPKIEDLSIKPSLIIFDEVHSLLSKGFIKVLMYPLVRVIKKDWDEIPYMIALSATYPPATSRAYKSLMKLFGKAFRTPSSITDIPVFIYDYYDHFQIERVPADGSPPQIFTGEEARGKWDSRYHGLDDYETIEYFADAIDGKNEDINRLISDKSRLRNDSDQFVSEQSMANNVGDKSRVNNVNGSSSTNNASPSVNEPTSFDSLQHNSLPTLVPDPMHDYSSCSPSDIALIDPTDTKHKGIIMCYTIDSSACAAMYVHLRWNVGVLIVRAVDETDLFIPRGDSLDYDFDQTVTYENLLDDGVGIQCKYKDYIDSASIIVGTFHRLKEGFSVQNITWGICTKFVWSYISRIQLVGRIRRSSNDPELNSRKRILMVSSGVRPSNLKVPRARKPYKWLYDLEVEKELFSFENYVRI